MSKPCFGSSCHGMAAEHLSMAMHHASLGRKKEAEDNLATSKAFAETHSRDMIRSGDADAADKYLQGHSEISGHIRSVLQRKLEEEAKDPTPQGIRMVTKKSEAEGDLKKDFGSGSGPKKPYSSNILSTKMVAGKPMRENPRYSYKRLSELHPDDQKSVQTKFSGKDMDKYKYAVSKETGRVEHVGRVAHNSPPSAAPSAGMIPQHHKEGSGVRIAAEGHPSHGKLGVVRNPSPYFPGKVAVQVGPTEHHVIHMDPHQIKPSKPTTKIEKALVALCSLRKAFRVA